MELRKIFLVAALLSGQCFAQQTIAPFKTQQANTVFYVNMGTGTLLTTIQKTVTAACAYSTATVVDILPGSNPSDTIAGLTSACTTTRIFDQRVSPGDNYTCNSGGCTLVPYATAGYFLGTPTVTVTGTPSNTSTVWVATSGNAAAPRQLTQDDILPGFGITGFTCSTCGNYEIGFTIASPTNFTASYTSTPASANITDGTHTDVLTTPFTSGSLAFSYTSSVQATTTFTLTAVSGVTRTAQQGISWFPRTFGGVGAAGATSSVTASGNNATLSNGATLTNAGLNNQSVYGPYSPSGQKIYILMIGGSHTFKDNSTGFSFAFNSPTAVSFVNQNGATVAMFLYESTNTLTGPFSILVAS